MNIALLQLHHRDQRSILRLVQWSDGPLRCSPSFRFHAPDRSPVRCVLPVLARDFCGVRSEATPNQKSKQTPFFRREAYDNRLYLFVVLGM